MATQFKYGLKESDLILGSYIQVGNNELLVENSLNLILPPIPILTDPPWNTAILNRFNVSAGFPKSNIHEFLKQFLVSISETPRGYIWFGVHHSPDLISELSRKFSFIYKIDSWYGSPGKILPCVLVCYSHKSIPSFSQNKADKEIHAEILSWEKTQGTTKMTDPFAGIGLFPRLLHEYGFSFYAIEYQSYKAMHLYNFMSEL